MPLFETSLPLMILTGLLAYGLGSVPFGLLLARMMKLGDLRQIGSGNIGATNVLRTGNKRAAAATLFLDAAKGAAAALIARFALAEDAAQLAGLMAFLGHLFPIWLGFKGGKGVATFLGVLLALAWPVGLACCATWLAAAIVSRMSSMAAITAAASATLWMFVFQRGDVFFLVGILTVLVFLRHHANIKRIKAGTETKIGQKPA